MTVIFSVILQLLLVTSAGIFWSHSLLPLAYGQPSEGPLPVLLIHGYASNALVWREWEERLNDRGIPAHAVTFSGDDECGTSEEHADELIQIVEDFKTDTQRDKINIVAHSKGGLDARLYLATNPSNDHVANLIMIGTPNAGSELADIHHEDDPCKPAVYDLLTSAPVNQVDNNDNTKYHTIASNWKSVYWPPFTAFDINCPAPLFWFDVEGWNMLTFQYLGRQELGLGRPSDGLVPIDSVEEPGQFNSLGRTDNCHTNMFTNEEYNKVLRVLLRPE